MIDLTPQVMALRQQGLTFVEIGQRLDLTKGQVAGLVFRATSPIYRNAKGPQAAGVIRRFEKFVGARGVEAGRKLLADLQAELDAR